MNTWYCNHKTPLFMCIGVLCCSVLCKTPKDSSNQPSTIIQYLDAKSTIKSDSEEAIIKYLPQRLKQLINTVKNTGIASAIQFVANDPDLDSYLFIFDNEEPSRLLAYSRHTELANKTPKELQQFLDPDCKPEKCFISKSLQQILSMARVLTTFTGYRWKMGPQDHDQYFISYTQRVIVAEKEYIMGATMASTHADVHIILPHRINQALKRIKQEGLEHVATTINKNLDYGYFYIIDRKYPHRVVTHKAPWTGLTPQEASIQKDPNCKRPECNAATVISTLLRSLESKGNFCVYPWINNKGEDPTLKIVYTKPFEYEKKKLFIGTGLPADISLAQARDLEKMVENSLQLIQDIGLENALSAAKLTNKPNRYIFIMEAEYPYKFLLHADPHYNQHNAPQIQAYINSRGKSSMNIAELTRNLAEHSKKGGGFAGFTFLIDTQNPEKGITLKVYYTKLLTYKGKQYVVGTGIPIERAYTELDSNSGQKT